MRRRAFLLAGASIPLATLVARGADGNVSMKPVEAMQARWRDFIPGDVTLDASLEPLKYDKKYWRSVLDDKRYHILFKEGTEPPFSSPLNDEKRAGVFACAACRLPLFTSEMKFDSGTGWPSFFTAIPGHLDTKRDFKLILPRTEYHCIRCGGHQGHIFDDGPRPTRERWCNNGLALEFIPKA
ncbi:MAG: peptide-methionine (R)-S-oxide reductase MsrB [Gammaproteobacteria bacterium]|nr:peptide-methionine (R)-S-oxide reductase MsrB [Gammaproteobacteria bacterium]